MFKGHFHIFKAKQHELPESWEKSGSDKSSTQSPIYRNDVSLFEFLTYF